MAPIATAQNYTVGDNVGADHTAFTFAPFLWEAACGEDAYRANVGPGGQQYSILEYMEANAPNPYPTLCTVTNFLNIIRNQTANLGTLLITSHGGPNAIIVENYAPTSAGLTARNLAFDAYINQGFTELYDILPWDSTSGYSIGIWASFIRNRGRLNRSLVFVAACQGASLTDAFTYADARVALGPPESCWVPAFGERVRTFFRRMNGKEGWHKRPVAQAKAGLGLTVTPAQNTTLAPVVIYEYAPCPIHEDLKVYFYLETACDTGVIPDIHGVNCTIEDERWIDSTTLEGTCKAPPFPGSYHFWLTVRWGNVKSSENASRLDGNTNPLASNGEGPAHDDYDKRWTCTKGSDDCFSAQPIDGTGLFTFDNSGATTGGPGSCSVNSDVWFLWTAPSSGSYVFRTCGQTSIDSVIAVYQGADCPPTAELGCDDDTCGLQSAIQFAASGGSEYLLRVGGYGTSQGDGSIEILPVSTALFEENFDHAPPYRAIFDATEPGGWGVDSDPYFDWPVHNGAGNYARAHDLCLGGGAKVDRMLRLPEQGELIDLTAQTSATLTLWAAHGVCVAGCPSGGADTCRLALRTFADSGGNYTEHTLLDFPDPTISGCGGAGAWEMDLSYDLTPHVGSYVQVVVHHDTGTIDHLVIDDVVVTGAGCPSPNRYCTTSANSVGWGSIIDYTGSTSVSTNDFGVVATGNPPDKFGLFFMGPNQSAVSFGNGWLCVSGSLTRYPVILSDGFGNASYAVDNTTPPALGKIVDGSTWYWQYWYRDPMGGGAAFNLSDGLSVTYCP